MPAPLNGNTNEGETVTRKEKRQMKTKKSILAAIAALATAHAALAQNFPFGTFIYNCHVVNQEGVLINDTTSDNKISLSVYRIGADGKTLSDLLQSAYVRENPAQKGFNCQLAINLTTSQTSSSATIGEQLALVVKEGSTEVWRSYTILPPVGEANTACHVGGILASADENGDAIADWYNDDFMQPWAEALEFTYGGADADDDNDGVSNLF